MTLSAKQQTAFDHARSDDVLYLGSGAVRSGKTAACGAAFGLFASLHDGDHVLIGRTEAAIMRNVVRAQPLGLLAAVRAAGWPAKVSGVDGRHVSIDGGRSKIWIFGASDIGAVDRIAGSTFKAGMVDEITRLQSGEELWQMLWTRFSTDTRKLWATTNPGALRHWAKRMLIDQRDKYQARVVSYTMDDNPTLSAAVKQGIAAGLFGHHRTRLIDGLWVDATGLIYADVPLGAMPPAVAHWSLGLDWAGSGVFAAVLLAHSVSGRVHIVAERYYDHRELGAITDTEQAKRIADWIREHTSTGLVVYGDPTTPTAFQYLLASHGHHWVDGKTDVLLGLQAVASGFGAGVLTVDASCTQFLREASEYSWDEKAAAKGEDKPQKGNDHGLDGLRYAWVTPSPVVTQYRWSP